MGKGRAPQLASRCRARLVNLSASLGRPHRLHFFYFFVLTEDKPAVSLPSAPQNQPAPPQPPPPSPAQPEARQPSPLPAAAPHGSAGRAGSPAEPPAPPARSPGDGGEVSHPLTPSPCSSQPHLAPSVRGQPPPSPKTTATKGRSPPGGGQPAGDTGRRVSGSEPRCLCAPSPVAPRLTLPGRESRS